MYLSLLQLIRCTFLVVALLLCVRTIVNTGEIVRAGDALADDRAEETHNVVFQMRRCRDASEEALVMSPLAGAS